jgi:hypothetical protein
MLDFGRRVEWCCKSIIRVQESITPISGKFHPGIKEYRLSITYVLLGQ